MTAQPVPRTIDPNRQPASRPRPPSGEISHMAQPYRSAMTRRGFLQWVGKVGVGLSGVGLAATGLITTGCTPSRSTSSTSGATPDVEITQLVYQDWRSDWFPDMVQEMLALFHEQHPTIRVFFTPDPPNLPETMLANMMAGTAPDLFQGCCTFFPIWAQHKYTVDLQPWVDAHLSDETINEWNLAQYQALSLASGHRYGLPKYHGGLALYYNKGLFDEAGVTYPDDSWTYQEYHEAMVKLTKDSSGNGTTDLWGSMVDTSWDRIQVHVNGWGGHLIYPELSTSEATSGATSASTATDKMGTTSRCGFGDPKTVAALEWLRARMWDDRVMATRLDVQNMATRSAFVNQRVAMVEDGSWALKEILTDANFQFGVAPFPQGPEHQVTLATTDGFGIYSDTHHPDAAWALMTFLISPEYGRAMARANFLQPARVSLVDEWIAMIQDEFPQQIAKADLAAFADGHRNGYSVTIETGPQMAALEQEAENVWEQIFTLGRESAEYAATVCKQFSASG